ncbi:MAG TPA: hypothetical protein PKE04_21610, partial [Clostridia bacterium]|nr:hypothetical protein [Clostridia bacterium]
MWKRSTTVRILALFMLVLLAFCLVFAYVHARLTRELTNEEISRAQRSMERGCSAVSESILSTYRRMGALSSYATVQTLATAQTLQPIHFAQILKLQNELKRSFASEEWLLRVQVFFDTEQGIAVSANDALHDVRAAFEDGRLAVDALSYETFCGMLRVTRNRKLQIKEFAGYYALGASGLYAKAQTNVVVIALKLAVPSSRSDVYAIAWIDVDALHASIAGDEPVSDLFALFSGESLLYTNRTLPPDISPLAPRQYHPAFDTTTISMQIQGTPLYGVLELPNAVVAEKIVALTSVLYVLLSVFIVLSATLFGMLLLTILRPLYRLSKRIGRDDLPAGGNVFAQIHRHLDDADAQALHSALLQLLLGFPQDGEVRAAVRALSEQRPGNRWYVWILGGPADDPDAWIPVRQIIAAQFRQVIAVSIDNA